MARHTHATFEGVEVLDVDPNALTRTRWLDKTAGDTALAVDLMRGDTGNLNHSGPGNGCLLSIPLANQMLGDWPVTGDGDTAAAEAVAFWSCLQPLPLGETTITVNVDWEFYEAGPEPVRLEVRDLTYTVVDDVELVNGQATATGLTGGTAYLFRLVCDDVSTWPVTGNKARSVSLGHFRIAPDDTPVMVRQPSDPTDSTELATKTVSSAVVADPHDFDSQEVITNALAISGYHATQLARTQSALIEAASGGPVGTNETRTIAPSSTQSAYHDHSRLGSEYPNAPTIGFFPLATWCLGAAPADGGTGKDGNGGNATGTRNCPGWAIAQSSTRRDLVDVSYWAPRHRTAHMGVFVLAYSPDGSLGGLTTLLEARVHDTSPSLVSSGTTSTWTQLGSSKWYYAQITGMTHEPQDLQRFRVGLTISAGTPKTNGGSFRMCSVSSYLYT